MHETGEVFFSKFLYVRDFPEYRRSIAHALDCTSAVLRILRSLKTYSRYLKKTRPSENPPVFLLTHGHGQYTVYVITSYPSDVSFFIHGGPL
eukprot:SAG11_NODE_117_length_15962_cov_71.527925_5_plen_92_part_00